MIQLSRDELQNLLRDAYDAGFLFCEWICDEEDCPNPPTRGEHVNAVLEALK
jgi:hypothetical protein